MAFPTFAALLAAHAATPLIDDIDPDVDGIVDELNEALDAGGATPEEARAAVLRAGEALALRLPTATPDTTAALRALVEVEVACAVASSEALRGALSRLRVAATLAVWSQR